MPCAMSDERTWYAVNRVTEVDLMGAGIFLVVSSILVYIFGDQVNPITPRLSFVP